MPTKTPPKKSSDRLIIIIVIIAITIMAVLFAVIMAMFITSQHKTSQEVASLEAKVPGIQKQLEAYYTSNGFYPASLKVIGVERKSGKHIIAYNEGTMTKDYETRNPNTVHTGNYTGICDYKITIEGESMFGIAGDTTKTSDKAWLSPPKPTCSLVTER